jgi:hypothetical protein
VRRVETLRLAIAAVSDRGSRYGEPEDNFGRIAMLWNGWMKIRKGGELGGLDVAVMLALMKCGRIVGNGKGHIDNFVDVAGYASCAGELATEVKDQGE